MKRPQCQYVRWRDGRRPVRNTRITCSQSVYAARQFTRIGAGVLHLEHGPGANPEAVTVTSNGLLRDASGTAILYWPKLSVSTESAKTPSDC